MAVAGDTVLGTSTGDPNFYQRKIANLSDALGGAFAAAQARRDQQQQRELEEIKTFYAMALKDPELASVMGDSYKAKYGDKYPTLSPMIDLLQNRARETKKITDAGDVFYANQQTIEQKYAQDQAALAAMPDQVEVKVPVPSFGMAGPRAAALAGEAHMGEVAIPVPNVEKVTRQAQLSQVQPALFEHFASLMMSPADRHRARIAGALTQPEPQLFGEHSDLPPDQRALAMATAGYLGLPDSDSYEAARIGAHLQQSPEKLQEQGFTTSEREAKAKTQAEDRTAREEAQTERQREADRLERGRMGYADSIERGHIAQRAENDTGGRGKTKPLWKTAVEESTSRIEEWEGGLKTAMHGSDVPAERKRDYILANGARPARLSADAAAKIEQRVRDAVKAGHVGPEDAESATARIVEAWTRLTQQGKSSNEALSIALSDKGPGG
jgi:hypothetical protein